MGADEVAAGALDGVELHPGAARDLTLGQAVELFLRAIADDNVFGGRVLGEFLDPCLELRVGDLLKGFAAAAHMLLRCVVVAVALAWPRTRASACLA